MIIQTEGIVLHTIKYSETSVISHIYTKEYGIGSYIMNNARSNRSKMAFFQPLSIITLQAYHKKNEKIHRIKEIGFQEVLIDISHNIYKSTIALFVGEIIQKLFREEEQHEDFFDFFKRFILFLEHETTSFADFHILFLYQTTHFLGIYPHIQYSPQTPYFDLHKAQYTQFFSEHCIDAKKSLLVSRVFDSHTFDIILQIQRTDRKMLLETIISYYSLHIHKLGTLKSLEILEKVFE